MPVPRGYTLEDKKKTLASRTAPPPTALPAMSSAPAFIRNAVDMSRVTQNVATPSADEQATLADVRADAPYAINVFHPEMYTSNTRDHELTHVFQQTRNANVTPYADTQGQGQDNYNYGGQGGLEAALRQHKTIASFNGEQQADIVKDYKARHDRYLQMSKQGKMTPKDFKEMYAMQQAYHPFIAQLAAMPGRNDAMKTIDMTPAAPGLPGPVAGIGVVQADPLMGGYSQPYRPRK